VFCGVINTLAHWRSNMGIKRDVTDTVMRAEQLRDQREHADQGGHPDTEMRRDEHGDARCGEKIRVVESEMMYKSAHGGADEIL
jgi:hypothetical protein